MFYFYWGVALCWKLKLRGGVGMWGVGYNYFVLWTMTARCWGRCGMVYAGEANRW